MALNCIDAIVTGENASATGAVCDFVTALFAIGDIRDMYIQAYNSIWDPENFDNTIRILAILGTTTTLAIASGGGAVLDGILASAKTFVKALRRLGPAGVKLKDLVGSYLDKKVISAASPEQAKVALELAGGFLQLGAFVSLEGENLKPVLNMMADGIDNLTDMETWFRFIKKYAAQAVDLVSQTNTSDKMLAFFIASAYAVLGDFITPRPIVDLANAMRRTIDTPLNSNETIIGKAFTRAIYALEKGAANGATTLDDVIFEDDTWRALVVAFQTGDEVALKALRNHNGFNLGLGDGSTKLFLKKMGDLDVSDFSIEAKEGLTKVYKSLQSGFRKSQGATHQLLDIAAQAKKKVKILRVEADEVIKSASGNSYNRVYDYVRKGADGAKDILVENKAWSPQNINKLLADSMSWKVSKEGEIPGQLYKDIINFKNRGIEGLEWRFEPRAAGKEEEIKEKILDLVEENKDKLKVDLGFNDAEWDTFFETDLPDNLKNFIKIAEY